MTLQECHTPRACPHRVCAVKRESHHRERVLPSGEIHLRDMGMSTSTGTHRTYKEHTSGKQQRNVMMPCPVSPLGGGGGGRGCPYPHTQPSCHLCQVSPIKGFIPSHPAILLSRVESKNAPGTLLDLILLQVPSNMTLRHTVQKQMLTNDVFGVGSIACDPGALMQLYIHILTQMSLQRHAMIFSLVQGGSVPGVN